jgi:hypothetical protein
MITNQKKQIILSVYYVAYVSPFLHLLPDAVIG